MNECAMWPIVKRLMEKHQAVIHGNDPYDLHSACELCDFHNNCVFPVCSLYGTDKDSYVKCGDKEGMIKELRALKALDDVHK